GIPTTIRDSLSQHVPSDKKILLNIQIIRIGEPQNPQILLVLEDKSEKSNRRDIVSALHNTAMSTQSMLDLDKVLFTVLTCATAGVAIGFSRAFLFLTNEENQTLEGKMGVGPVSYEDAKRVWDDLNIKRKTLEELIEAYDAIKDKEQIPLRQFARKVNFSLNEQNNILVQSIKERRTILVSDANSEPLVMNYFREMFSTDSFVCVPLISRNRTLGVVIADNKYSNRPITERMVQLLETFVSQAALAIDNAEAYANIQSKVDSLEKAYDALQTAQEKLIMAEQMAIIGNMAARIAHEIRNPLVTIGGFARSINRSPERTSRVKSNAWIIVQEVERLEQILSGIMNFARPSTPVFEQNNINRIIDEVIQLVQNESLSPAIEIIKELDESIPLVTVDGQQIKSVLLNLINNAIAALESEGKIIIKTEAFGDFFEISISDTGRGISLELQDKLFIPFFTTRSSGTGLGLPIVKKIVEDHNGSISYKSISGEGTTFFIKLPVRQKQSY
ncbi:MAG: ATP-binding protein, partial [Planctomycetota bacterium]